MTYTVHSIFKTIQGEGAHSGRVAVFCRFAGCNLWTGREEDRATAICRFCDTDFVGGEKFQDAESLAHRIESTWGHRRYNRFVVLTGGEPALQYDLELGNALRQRGFYIAIETNGTRKLPAIDWICVSPKSGSEIELLEANEVKFVFPQKWDPAEIRQTIRADYYSIQPMDGPRLRENTADAIEFCLEHPEWRLGIQMHKFIGVA